MSINTIKITENLTLRRIESDKILNNYVNGNYVSLTFPSKKINIITSTININKRLGKNSESEMYKFNNKSNNSNIIVTTNHENYKNDPNTKSFCKWCRKEITGQGIGIPISIDVNEQTGDIVVHCIDKCDTFECALALLKRIYGCNYVYKDPLYKDSDTLLHYVYHLMHPDKINERIKEAKDWSLLDINGGPLTSEEWESSKYEYVSVQGLVLSPVKRQYMKLSVTIKK